MNTLFNVKIVIRVIASNGSFDGLSSMGKSGCFEFVSNYQQVGVTESFAFVLSW